jgi:putative ABC transport system substrate-binding protein
LQELRYAEEAWMSRTLSLGTLLQGVNVAGLPIEQPVKFDFVLNMRTAKALGLTIPPSLIALADEVIE